MSSQRHARSSVSAPTPALPQELTCSCCEEAAGPALALQCYPAPEGDHPAGVDPDGGVVLCASCASESVELLATWADHDEPEIDPEASIGEGYRAVATDCSFCADSLGDSGVTGVELYDAPGETLPAYANYTLCADCQDVFGEFLTNVRDES
jgi:hypothetical protein